MSDENNQKKLNFSSITTTYQAIGIIEEFEPIPQGLTYEQAYIQAFQHLRDTVRVGTLQGTYGRTAINLIEHGICTPPQKS